MPPLDQDAAESAPGPAALQRHRLCLLLLLLLLQGWGLASLDQDASELHLLSQHLAQQHGSKGWVLMGHSTGCQDAVRCAYWGAEGGGVSQEGGMCVLGVADTAPQQRGQGTDGS